MANKRSKLMDANNIQNFKDRAKWLSEFAMKNFEAYYKNKENKKLEIAIVHKTSAIFAIRKLLDICDYLSSKDLFTEKQQETFLSLADFIDLSVGFDSFTNDTVIKNMNGLIKNVILPVVSIPSFITANSVWATDIAFDEDLELEPEVEVETEKVEELTPEEFEEFGDEINEENEYADIEYSVEEETVESEEDEMPSLLDLPDATIPKEAVLQTTAVPKQGRGRPKKEVVVEEELVQPTKKQRPTYAEFMGNAPQATGRNAYLNSQFAEKDKENGESVQIPPPTNFRG